MKVDNKNNKLKSITRILTVVFGLALIAVVFVPIWKIQLEAPQYPEGLEMKIHANKMTGQIDIINGLNNYIGMRQLREDDFVEFKILPFLIGAIGFFGVITALVNRRWFFFSWAVVFVLFAVLAMVDFYLWEYNYGHNLNPQAPIQVPGMAYSPPLIGSKQLLNFKAYSYPDIGGWIMFVVGLGLVYLSFIEIKNSKKYVAKPI